MNNQADKKTVHRGDCGHFHESDDMETITLKIRKGKDCDLETTIGNLFPQVDRPQVIAQPTPNNTMMTINTKDGPMTVTSGTKSVVKSFEITPTDTKPNPYAIPGYDPSDPKVVKLLNADEKAKFLKESAIPVEFARRLNPLLKAGIGIEPGDPQFESKGATIVRRA